MSHYALQQVNKEVYDRIARDYFSFIAATSDPSKQPVRVFSPLSPQMLAELELIRTVSQELQAKKVEEALKAKAEAEEREAKKQENAEEESQAEDGEVKEVTENTEEVEKKEE